MKVSPLPLLFSHIIIRCLILAVSVVYCSAGQAGGQTPILINDRGWYTQAGQHTPSNNNTYTGNIGARQYRSYFRFSIPSQFTCVGAATLEIELENHYGGSSHTMRVFDVDPVNVPRLDLSNGGGFGVAIYNDLGGGTQYGIRTGITSADVGQVFSFPLPPAALAQIASAAGTSTAFGVSVNAGGGASTRGLRFSGGNESRIHRLTLWPCVGPDFNVQKTTQVYDPLALDLMAVPGNDIVYTLTVTNTGAGSADPDTIFLVDTLPGEVTFYNGDANDDAPGTDPVIFVDSGSGLTFNYATDIAYSSSATMPPDWASCNHTPSPGYDPLVRHVCIRPGGSMLAGSPDPAFSIWFRTRIE